MASSGKTTTFLKQESSSHRGTGTVVGGGVGSSALGVAIKQEQITLKSGERLSSFRLPRDLTLGGINPARVVRNPTNKKVYTPNLNAVRNKNA